MARVARIGVIGAALLSSLLLVVIAYNSFAWVGRTFPGFFVISNRVVPSIALPQWANGDTTRFFQHQVVSVDGAAVSSATMVYAHVAARPPETPIHYGFRATDGQIVEATIPSQSFSLADYVLIQGAYLLTGFFFLGTGLLVAYLKPASAASRALLITGVVTGFFVITGVDLYGPHWFVPLHVVCETFMAPAFIHLAMVFPTDRWRRRRVPFLFCLYGLFAGFAALYLAVFDSPSAYTYAHLSATATHGAGAVVIIGAVLHDLLRSPSALARRRVAVVAVGTLGAFLIPAVTMAASATLGGAVPVNAGALTAFLFPVSLGYAIVKQDLFEIDAMLRRAVSYALVVMVLAGLYFAALSGLGYVVPTRVLASSPMLLATLNLVLLFSIAPIQVRIRRAVEIVFSRRGYDADRVLSELSSSLASAHTLGEVRARLDRVLTESLFPVSTAMFEWSGGPALCPVPPGNEATEPLVLPPPLAARAERAEILAVYEWDDGSQRPVPPIWRALEADLMVPVCSGQRPMAMVTLGPKASGRTYNDRDVAFLRGVASQVAMALASAEAFGELERLNASLEQQVQERTAALQEANGDLKRSYEDVRVAYQQLEKSQESLMRSDRLATLGRLTASIAHEVNTPLGAALNSLTMLRDLGAEYAESIEDPAVTTQDHRQIATDLLREVEQATRFARNAAAFVNRVRIHGRDTDGQGDQRFLVKSVVAETQALLAHRMRAVCCSLSFEQAEDVTLVGDPTRLGQVLTNLVANAVDAYEDARILDGSVDVAARRIEDRIVLTVRDRAGGIPAEILPRIFDELFTTKPPGRGTGLGLCIARSVVERSFGGTMAVESEQGVGTCFTLTLPVAREGRDAAPPAPAVA